MQLSAGSLRALIPAFHRVAHYTQLPSTNLLGGPSVLLVPLYQEGPVIYLTSTTSFAGPDYRPSTTRFGGPGSNGRTPSRTSLRRKTPSFTTLWSRGFSSSAVESYVSYP